MKLDPESVVSWTIVICICALMFSCTTTCVSADLRAAGIIGEKK